MGGGVNWGIEMNRVIERKYEGQDIVTVCRLEWLGL